MESFHCPLCPAARPISPHLPFKHWSLVTRTWTNTQRLSFTLSSSLRQGHSVPSSQNTPSVHYGSWSHCLVSYCVCACVFIYSTQWRGRLRLVMYSDKCFVQGECYSLWIELQSQIITYSCITTTVTFTSPLRVHRSKWIYCSVYCVQ